METSPLQDRKILWKSSNFGYEEGYQIVIYEQNNKYYMEITGHNVMIGDYDSTEEVTSDQALEIMLAERDNEDDFE